MRTQYAVLVILAVPVLGACAPHWPWKKSPPPQLTLPCGGDKQPTCDLQNLVHAMADDVAKYCEGYRKYYANGYNYSRDVQFGVGIAGTLAGAVVAPIAQSARAKSGLAGFSGAANAMQQQINTTFSTVTGLNQAAAVTDAYREGMLDFAQAVRNMSKDPAAQVLLPMIVTHTAMMCATAGDAASQDELMALTSSVTGRLPPSSKTPNGATAPASSTSAATLPMTNVQYLTRPLFPAPSSTAK